MTRRDINTSRLILSCIYNDWETAELMVRELEPYLTGDSFITRAHNRSTYMGLAAIKIGRQKGKKYFRNIGQKALKLYKSDVKKGSVNAHPVLTMFQAEEHPSKEAYDKAIKTCARLGLTHHEAYMCERAGVYFLQQKDEGWAEFYLVRAHRLYSDWGAYGKSETMKHKHDSILYASLSISRRNMPLKGRSRYSSIYADQLREVSWSRLSSVGSSHSLDTGDSSF